MLITNKFGSRSWILANSPFAMGAPGYNANLVGGPMGTNGMFSTPGSPPVFPGVMFSGRASVDEYNAYAIAHGYMDPTGNGLGPYLNLATTPGSMALIAANAPNPYVLLNTTKFGTVSILSQDRREAFASGAADLYGKQLQFFGQFLFANTESIGALAPSPVPNLGPFGANINVPASNVYNPFQIDLGPAGVSANPTVRSRFVQSGNRIFDSQTDFYHVTAGFKGEFENGYAYDAAYVYNRGDQIQFTRNAINGAALDQALQPNSDPALAAQGLSQLRGADNNFVPMYNIFFSPTDQYPTRMGPNSPATINAISTTLFQTGRAEEYDAEGHITGQPFDLPGGKLGFAVGGGFRSESLHTDFDGLTRIGKVPGLNSALPTNGKRDSWAGFVEVHVPITSPDMNVPAFHSFEVTAAGRYETFSPGGDAAVPKIAVRWQPLDEQFTLRGTYSKSFVAPTTFQLFGGNAQNNPFINIQGNTAQFTTLNVSNPKLKPVNAENYGGGIVISPKAVPNLTVSADYFHIHVKNDIFRASEQGVINDLNLKGSASPYADKFRFIDGTVLATPAANQITADNYGLLNASYFNGAETITEGVDLGVNYMLPLDPEKWGRLNLFANSTVTFEYQYDDPTIHTAYGFSPDTGLPIVTNHGPYHYKGVYTDRANGIGGGQGLIPDWQVAMGLSWDFHDFTYTVNARYVPTVNDPGDAFPAAAAVDSNGKPFSDYTVNGKNWTIESWYSIDMQLAYRFTERWPRWVAGTRLAIGCNNVTDNAPPIIASSFEDNTDKSTYDILGRFIYFEVSKKF